MAAAVNPDLPYVRVRQGDESYIIAKARLDVLDGPYDVIEEMPGSALVDLTYEPLFTDMAPDGLAFIVTDAAEMVSMDEGTRRETSPLLATLMTSELSRLAFESA